jgi:hypothetical protein
MLLELILLRDTGSTLRGGFHKLTIVRAEGSYNKQPVLKLEYKALKAGRVDVESLYHNTLWYSVNSFCVCF